MKVPIDVDRGDVAECKWGACVRDGRIAGVGLDHGVNRPLEEGIVRCECVSDFEDVRVTKRTGLGYSVWHKRMEPMGIGSIDIVLEGDDRFVASQRY